MTDWSFQQEELLNCSTESNDLGTPDDCVGKEVTHIYVTQQKIHHFFLEKMKIKAEGKSKMVFFLKI